MSEKIPRIERGSEHLLDNSENTVDKYSDKLPEKEPTKAEQAHGEADQIERLRQTVENKAQRTPELDNNNITNEKEHPVLVNKQLKEMAYSRSLTRVRKHLSIPSKAFSKVIHSRLVDRPSEFVSNTIARPSSMLGGAIFSLVGTSILLWVTKHYGYEFNYLAAILLFASGMVFGIATEGLLKVFRKH